MPDNGRDMKRPSLVTELSSVLLNQIVAGTYMPGDSLPSEGELSRQFNVSRVTVREATKTLEARDVITVRSGKGITVNPVHQWSSIDSVVKHASHEEGDQAVAMKLIEVRRMLETGAAGHAAQRRSPEQLAEIGRHLERMRVAQDEADIEALAQADLDFHDAILHASGNVFIDILYEPIRRTLHEHRLKTATSPSFRQNNIAEHDRILAAIRSGNASEARTAMEQHMDQVERDFTLYLPSAASS